MTRRRIFAFGGATLALALTPALAGAAAKPGGGSTTVTVRVEGLGRTLVAPTQVTVPTSGWITKGGTPKGKCSARTAAGALDIATHHRWGGSYTTSFGLELTSILGETHAFTSKAYWSLWIGNRFGTAGICALKPRRGEQLLFAALPDTLPSSKKGYPVVIAAPATDSAGHAFRVTVDYVGENGKRIPLAHARVAGTGVSATTNTHGVATIDPHKSGVLVLKASAPGYIRSAPETVRVS